MGPEYTLIAFLLLTQTLLSTGGQPDETYTLRVSTTTVIVQRSSGGHSYYVPKLVAVGQEGQPLRQELHVHPAVGIPSDGYLLQGGYLDDLRYCGSGLRRECDCDDEWAERTVARQLQTRSLPDTYTYSAPAYSYSYAYATSNADPHAYTPVYPDADSDPHTLYRGTGTDLLRGYLRLNP